MIDCSSGQVSKRQQPVYGRMYQTPFADRIRNEAGIPTIAVGAISEADHVNSIIAAGRADLCAVAAAAPRQSGVDAARDGQDRLHRRRLAEAVPRRQGPARAQPRARAHDGGAGLGRVAARAGESGVGGVMDSCSMHSSTERGPRAAACRGLAAPPSAAPRVRCAARSTRAAAMTPAPSLNGPALRAFSPVRCADSPRSTALLAGADAPRQAAALGPAEQPACCIA